MISERAAAWISNARRPASDASGWPETTTAPFEVMTGLINGCAATISSITVSSSASVFAEAARGRNFSRAADELSVTPGAVSQQVRQLEDSLGQRLFLRQNNALHLTMAGKSLLPHVRESFSRLLEATNLVRSKNFENILKLSAPPTFTTKWLRPRLVQFQNMHPDLDIRLSASKQLIDFSKEDLDAAIRYGRGTYEGLACEKIMSEDIFPVCSPALLTQNTPLRTPADLKHHKLLHAEQSMHDETAPDWTKWFRAVCPESIQDINMHKGASPGWVTLRPPCCLTWRKAQAWRSKMRRSWPVACKHMMTQRRRFVSLKPAGGTEQLTSSIGLPIMRAAFTTPAWPMRHKPIVISPLNGRQTKYAIAMTICLSTMP